MAAIVAVVAVAAVVAAIAAVVAVVALAVVATFVANSKTSNNKWYYCWFWCYLPMFINGLFAGFAVLLFVKNSKNQ